MLAEPIEYRYAPAGKAEIINALAFEGFISAIVLSLTIATLPCILLDPTKTLGQKTFAWCGILAIDFFVFIRDRNAFNSLFLRSKNEHMILSDKCLIHIGSDGKEKVRIPVSELKSIEPPLRRGPYNAPVYMIASTFQSIPLYPNMINSDRLIEKLRSENPSIRFRAIGPSIRFEN